MQTPTTMSNNVAFPKVPVIIFLIHLLQVLAQILVIPSDYMRNFLQYFPGVDSFIVDRFD